MTHDKQESRVHQFTFGYTGPYIEMDHELMNQLQVKYYECYEDRSGLKLTKMVTIEKYTPTYIERIFRNNADNKTNTSERIVLKEVGASPLVMTFPRSRENPLGENFIYKGIQRAISTGDPTYHKWTNEDPKSKKARRVHKELEIDMVHSPLQSRKKKAREEEEEEEEGVGEVFIEENDVSFSAGDGGAGAVAEVVVHPPPRPAAEVNRLREAAEVLESLMEVPISPRVPSEGDGREVVEEEEVRLLRQRIVQLEQRNAELEAELRGHREAVDGHKLAVEGHREAVEGHREAVLAHKDLSKSRLSELKTLKQMVAEFKARAKHYEQLSFQLRGKLGQEQREVNRPVREENVWLKERVADTDQIHKEIKRIKKNRA